MFTSTVRIAKMEISGEAEAGFADEQPARNRWRDDVSRHRPELWTVPFTTGYSFPYVSKPYFCLFAH
jgi:hypothetical protein